MKAAKKTYDLDHLATEGVKDFDTSERDTYTEEEPTRCSPTKWPHFSRPCCASTRSTTP
jgi:hypothetical protein